MAGFLMPETKFLVEIKECILALKNYLLRKLQALIGFLPASLYSVELEHAFYYMQHLLID